MFMAIDVPKTLIGLKLLFIFFLIGFVVLFEIAKVVKSRASLTNGAISRGSYLLF